MSVPARKINRAPTQVDAVGYGLMRLFISYELANLNEEPFEVRVRIRPHR